MALKTVPNQANVDEFIAGVVDEQQREDCKTLLKIMHDLTGETPGMWGTTIVGFGDFHYRYASGREGDWFLTGFSPRKQNLSIYIMEDIASLSDITSRLGKHKHGKGCLYVKRLLDIDSEVLKELITVSIHRTKERYKDVNP
ncbi:MAG: DUF1801 domain-containing protein [Bacteroidota bacterium]